MSIKIMNWVFDSSPVSGAQRWVLLALADAASDEGWCWPSLNTIARKSGITRRSVIRIINQLEDIGLLQRQLRWVADEKINENITNLYRILWPGVVTQSHQGSDTESPRVVTQSHQGSDTESPRVVTQRHQGSDTESPKSSLNHQLEPSVKPPVQPPPPPSASTAEPGAQPLTKEEEGLLQAVGDELTSWGIYSKTQIKIVQAMIERGASIMDVREIWRSLQASQAPERARALLLTRTQEFREHRSSIGYTNSTYTGYSTCRCGRVMATNSMTEDRGVYLCDECYFEAHPEEEQ